MKERTQGKERKRDILRKAMKMMSRSTKEGSVEPLE
jgi:hypothetical protein